MFLLFKFFYCRRAALCDPSLRQFRYRYRLQTGTLIRISNRDGCIDGDLNAMHQLFYLNIPYFIIHKVYFDAQTFLLCYFSCNEEWLHQQGFCNHLYPEVIYHLWKDIMGWLPLLMRLPLPCCELMFDHSSSDLRAELSWRPHNWPCDGCDRLISAALPPTAAAAGGREDFPGFQGQPGVAGNPFLLCSPWAKKVGMNPALGLVSSSCSPAVVEAMRRLGLSAAMMPAAIRQHWNYIEAQRDSAGCR